MTRQPIKDVSEYKRLKQTLRDRFEFDRTGDQTLFEEQTKKYKPLLSSQKRPFSDYTGCCQSNSRKPERRTSGVATSVTYITEYAKGTNSSSESTGTIGVHFSITICHSSNIADGAGIRSRFHITHTHSNWPGFIS